MCGAHLIGRTHAGIEDVLRNSDKSRVRNPGAVVAIPHLPLLVSAHLRAHQRQLASAAGHVGLSDALHTRIGNTKQLFLVHNTDSI
jgi:hypothetical protein